MNKTIKSIWIWGSFFVVLSCGKSNDAVPSSINGTWQWTELILTNCTTSLNNKTQAVSDGSIFVFSSGNFTDKLYTGAVSGTGTYVINGSQLSIKYLTGAFTGRTYNWQFVLSGNNLTFTNYASNIGCTQSIVYIKQ